MNKGKVYIILRFRLVIHISTDSVQDADELDEDDTKVTNSAMKLTHEELIGNIFLFLIAGHEVCVAACPGQCNSD